MDRPPGGRPLPKPPDDDARIDDHLAHADIVAHTFRDRNGRVRIHVGAGGVWENPRTYIVTKDRFRRFPEPGVLTPKAFIQALTPTVPQAVPAGGEASP